MSDFDKSSAFDFRAKRRELLDMWQETFDLFKAVIESAKAGEAVLRASMAKEVNTFLKASVDILDKAEQEEERARLAEGHAPSGTEFMGDPDLEEHSSLDDSPDDRPEGFAPIDCQDEPLKLD